MKKTKRLVMLALALVLTFAMATTTTFAWFTMNAVVTVEGISGKATSAEGLFISPDGATDWKAYLDFDTDVNFEALTIGTAIPSGNVTAPVVGTTYELDGEDKDIFFYNAEGEDADAADYFSKQIFFRSDVAMDIKLMKIKLTAVTTNGKTITTPQGFAANTFGTHDAFDEDAVLTTNIINALRLAVFGSDGKLIAVYSFQMGDDGFWDTKATTGAYTGLNLAAALYKQITAKDIPVTGDGVAAEQKLLLDSGIYKPEVVVATTDGTVNNVTSCTIVIWVEGLDGHCLNNIIDQTVDVELEFEGIQK